MAALVSVPISCSYTDPDGTASSFGQVTATLPARVKVPSSTSVPSGFKTWTLASGAIPAGAVLMAPAAGNGSITYQITESIEGRTSSYQLTLSSANSTGVDLSTVAPS